jgi:hypothetical protein
VATHGIAKVFEDLGRSVPDELTGWEDRVDAWCSEYRVASADSEIVEVNLGSAVYLFDLTAERVVLAYAVSVEQTLPRDAGRMRGFPDVNVSVQAVTGGDTFPADRGHFLSHATGGGLDMNLFPQQRDLNRGWSPEGKMFRQMERFTAARPGVFSRAANLPGRSGC